MTPPSRNPILRTAPLWLSSLLAAALATLPGGVASATSTRPTASSVLAATTRALKHESSVHVFVETLSGKTRTSVVADIGLVDSTETVTSGKESFTITVTPSYAYLSGSPSGLTTLMGLTNAEQKKVGQRAIAMKKGTSPYSTFQQNLSSSKLLHLLPPVKGTTLLAARDRKTRGFQLSWTTAASATQSRTTTVMVVSAGQAALPIRENVTTTVGRSTTTFTKWNEVVHVTVPTNTIPYAKVIPSSS